MSYQIYYGQQFVKLSEGRYLPMTLSGSNNCTFMHRGKEIRERDWRAENYWTAPNRTPTADELLAGIDRFINEYVDKCDTDEWYKEQKYTKEDVRKRFGYYASLAVRGSCAGTSASQFRSIYSSGIKNAMTIEELQSLGISIRFYHYKWYDSTYSEPEPEAVPITSEEVFWVQLRIRTEWMNRARIIDKNGKEEPANMSITFWGDAIGIQERLQEHRAGNRIRQKKEPVYVDVDRFYVLKNSRGYLFKYHARGYKYGYGPGGGKKFLTAKEAEKYKAALVKKGLHESTSWIITEQIGNAQIRKAV